MRELDVAIAGGGPAGSAAALGLRRQFPELSVALIDRPRTEGRFAEALPAAAAPLLQRIGAWEPFLEAGFPKSPATAVSWGSSRLEDNHHLYSPWGAGWHLARVQFDRLLIDAAERAGVVVCRGAGIALAAPCHEGFELGVNGTERWRARFVLDATGAASRFARMQGARRRTFDHLLGFGRFLGEDAARDPRTVVEASPDGWWYSCRLGEGRVVVFMTDADIGRELGLARRAPWLERLMATTWMRKLVEWKDIGSRGLVVRAFSSSLSPTGGTRWLAVGDAAATMSPLAGCGVARALRSGLTGSYAAGEFLLSGEAKGLERYRGLHAQEFASYLASADRFYRAEPRFSERPFWRRRVGPAREAALAGASPSS